MEKSKTKNPQPGFSQGQPGSSSSPADRPEDQGQNPVATLAHDIQQEAAGVAQRAQEAGANVAHRAQEAGANVAHRAQEVGSSMVGRADDAVAAAGRGIESVASGIRNVTPEGGVVGATSGYVADTIESGGKYLEEHGLSGIAEDVTELIRRNPIPALLIGIGIGFIIARATTPRS